MTDDPETCYACAYPAAELTEYDWPTSGERLPEEKAKFCKLCANTFGGNAFFYPSQYPNRDVLRMLGYIGNTLLDEIRKLKEVS